jgi:hypothetical protein
LIALRISSDTARDVQQWTQPVTGIVFRRRHISEDVVLSALNSSTNIAVNKFNTTDVESRGETIYAGKKPAA